MMEDCKLELKLADKPGELSKVLDIVAKNKGNLFSVSHLREQMKEGSVPVVIKFQSSKENFGSLIADLEGAGIEILEKIIGGMEESQFTRQFILIGHVIDTDIKDTLYTISGKDVIVKSLEISINSFKEPSSVFAELSAKSVQALDEATKKLEAVAKKKEITLITGIQ